MKRQRSPRRAFLLVFTLGMWLLALSVLGTVAARTSSATIAAKRRVVAIQRTWGIRSAERALTKDPRRFLEEEETGEPSRIKRISHRTFELQLHDLFLQAELAEEDAKLNINTLFERLHHDVAQTAAAIRTLTGDDRSLGPVLVRPLSEAERSGSDFPAFIHLDQLCDPKARTRSHGLPRRITLWGKGRVDFLTADPATIKLACGPKVSTSDLVKLLAFADSEKGSTLEEAIKASDLKQTTAEQIRLTLTDKPSAYSLTIHAQDHWERIQRTIVLTLSESGKRRVHYCQEHP